MKHLRVRPTKADIALAEAVARRTTPLAERQAQAMTWLADEKLLFAASFALWLASKRGSARQRLRADHLLLTVLVSCAVPHLLKRVIDQERPDRQIRRWGHGIPKSGRRLDAFPSGHAMHIGAIASAVSWIEPRAAPWVWAGGVAIACTRIVLLAHWASDVIVGLCAGAALERLLRPISERIFANRVALAGSPSSKRRSTAIMAKAKDKTLQDLFQDTLKDIYFAEKKILSALPKMAKAAESDDLKVAFEKHEGQTETHVERLEQVFEEIDAKPQGKTCDAIMGIIAEGQEVMKEYKGTPALDAGLLAAAQAVEHYEISRYGTLITWANELGLKKSSELLRQTLDEEKDTDAALTELAESAVNQQAQAAE